jgi:hypothetical protein
LPGYPTNSKGPDINCLVPNSCADTSIEAYSEDFFTLNCMNTNACTNTTISCGTAQVCELHCQPYTNACKNTVLQCGMTKNLCYWDCESGADVCSGSYMYCSENKDSANVCLSQCGTSGTCTNDNQYCTTANSQCYCWDANKNKNCPGMTVNV